MRRTLARDVLRTGVSKLDEINVAKEAFARAEEHWGYRQIQLIDESGAKILLNGGDAASHTNVFPIFAAAVALSRARWIPSVMKWNVVPPCIGIDSRG